MRTHTYVHTHTHTHTHIRMPGQTENLHTGHYKQRHLFPEVQVIGLLMNLSKYSTESWPFVAWLPVTALDLKRVWVQKWVTGLFTNNREKQ